MDRAFDPRSKTSSVQGSELGKPWLLRSLGGPCTSDHFTDVQTDAQTLVFLR